MRAGLIVAALCSMVAGGLGCAPSDPYVRYSGRSIARPLKGRESLPVFKDGPPPAPTENLGTVIVVCPSKTLRGPGGERLVGGCAYDWAIKEATRRAARAGADGIHSVTTTTNDAHAITNLSANAFLYVAASPARQSTGASAAAAAPPPVQPPPVQPPPEDNSVEARLRRLEKLKADQLITPEEYDKKRAEILKAI